MYECNVKRRVRVRGEMATVSRRSREIMCNKGEKDFSFFDVMVEMPGNVKCVEQITKTYSMCAVVVISMRKV